MNIVAPSILAADFAELGEEIKRVKEAPWLHIDVMDGHFVPNIAAGLPILRSLRRVTDQFLDVHLMISDPLIYGPQFANLGADMICFHLESERTPERVIEIIRYCGKKVGLALKPATPVEAVFPYLTLVDMVLIMTVEPGFGGQCFQKNMLPKIRSLRQAAEKRAPHLLIEVDGGINLATANACAVSGANVLVSGSYIFDSESPAKAVMDLQLV